MKTLYLDIFSGISGDMFLGAMLDLGVDFAALQGELARLGLEGYHLHAGRAQRQAIEGVKFDVHLDDHHGEHEHRADSGAHEHHHDEGRHHSHEGRHHSHEGHHHDHEGHHHDHEGHHHDHEGHHHDHEGHHHSHEGHRHDAGHSAHEHGRNFADIKAMIATSGLSEWVKTKSIAVFQRVAVAEGKIHGRPPEKVHFHEVGAVDSIVDIVGACIALEMLGQPRVLAGPAVDGSGWIDCAHGRFPIPAPATLEILAARGVVVSQCDEPHELITPTGAALLAEFVEEFGPMRNLRAARVGMGVGGRENHTRPNVLRAILGESESGTAADWETDTVAVIESNLDDVTPEILGHFVGKALAAGALDVFHTPVQMKKNRPGVLLTVLCAVAEADKFSEMILRETTAFGVRRATAERRKLRREFITVETPFGPVSVKIGRLNGRIIQASPEYESCQKLAAEKSATLKDVYAAAARAAAGFES